MTVTTIDENACPNCGGTEWNSPKATNRRACLLMPCGYVRSYPTPVPVVAAEPETFATWWTDVVGHPPATPNERYAFTWAQKGWDAAHQNPMPEGFRQKLAAIQQMLTIADTREQRVELSERLIILGLTLEPTLGSTVPNTTEKGLDRDCFECAGSGKSPIT